MMHMATPLSPYDLFLKIIEPSPDAVAAYIQEQRNEGVVVDESAAKKTLRLERLMITSEEELQKLPPETRQLYILSEDIRSVVPIQECGEPLVDLTEYLTKHHSSIRLSVGATYGARSIMAYRLRTQAAERLFRAEAYLRKETHDRLTLQLTDAFRPLALQQQYFLTIWKHLAFQKVPEAEIYKRVTALTADPNRCPPHSTGGAVDLTLVETKTGREVDMGTRIDDVANEHLYLWHPDISSEARASRELLCAAMISAGFAELSREWAHYSYGDQEWAIRTGQKHAIYNVV